VDLQNPTENLPRVRPWKSLTWPNRISIIRLLAIAPFILLLSYQGQWPPARHLALALYAAMGVSDWLDGVLARRLDCRTRLGAILDPIADKTLIISAAVLLATPWAAVPGHRLPVWVTVAIVGKDLWVIVGFMVIYLVTDRFLARPSKAGKYATACQLVMVVAVLAAPDVNDLTGTSAGTIAARVMHWVVLAISLIAVISYGRLGLVFLATEQKPLDSHHPPLRDKVVSEIDGQSARAGEHPAPQADTKDDA
jgi:cardiolipin synthase